MHVHFSAYHRCNVFRQMHDVYFFILFWKKTQNAFVHMQLLLYGDR